MDLNDVVSITLYRTGADGLNEQNRQFQEQYPLAAEYFPATYKEGDIYTAPLWKIFWELAPHIRPDQDLPFHNLVKAEL